MSNRPLRLFAMNLTEFHQQISNADKPVVVDFWAEWCVPCRMTKPILEKLAHEYSDRVLFLPVDADESREVLEHFRVIGIPTVITFHNGDVVARVTGARNESEYRALFEALANGERVEIRISSFDRMLRLGAGLLFAAVGIFTDSWLPLGIGCTIAFLGFYDRCPVWEAVSAIGSGKKSI